MRTLPGILLAIAVAAVSMGLRTLLPVELRAGLSEAVLAVALGLALRSANLLPSIFDAGIRFSLHTLLRVAIVLLGLRFSLAQIVAIGGDAILLVILLMLLSLAIAHGLGRVIGVPTRLCSLIGVGTAVCGNSAISATAPVIGAGDEELSYAIGVNTLFGTIAVFAYPWLGEWMRMDPGSFGTWAGTAVNDTSQVVATGFARGEVAGGIATAVKLTRNALMGFVIVGMATAYGRRGESTGSRWKASLPPFVLGFLLLAAANSAGWVSVLSDFVGRDIASDGTWLAKRLVVVALAGVGLGTRLRSLRALGWRPLALGLATALTTSLVSLAWIRWIGAAG